MKLSTRMALLLCPFVFLTARPVGATECIPFTVEESVAGAHMVVIGSVTAMDDSVLIRSGNTVSIPETGVPYMLDIERVYKGESGPSLTIHQRWFDGAPNLQVGDRWLLFLNSDEYGNLTAGPCTPSAKLESGNEPSPELLAAVGEGRVPDGVWGYQGYTAVLGVASVGVGLYSLWHFRRRPR